MGTITSRVGLLTPTNDGYNIGYAGKGFGTGSTGAIVCTVMILLNRGDDNLGLGIEF